MSGLMLSGTVLDIEHVNGQSDGQSYSYVRLFILAGREVIQARVSDNYAQKVGGTLPNKDDHIAATVAVRPYKDRSNTASVGFSLIEPVDLAQLRPVKAA